jgi:hypothetical protein
VWIVAKSGLFAGIFGTPSAVAASGAVHRDTCGYVRIPVGLCRDAGVDGTNPLGVGPAGDSDRTTRCRCSVEEAVVPPTRADIHLA